MKLVNYWVSFVAIVVAGCAPKPAQPVPVDGSYAVTLRVPISAPLDGTATPALFSCEDQRCVELFDSAFQQIAFVAEARRSSVDSRVLFKVTSVHLMKSGKYRQHRALNGWVIGEDEQRGITGKRWYHWEDVDEVMPLAIKVESGRRATVIVDRIDAIEEEAD